MEMCFWNFGGNAFDHRIFAYEDICCTDVTEPLSAYTGSHAKVQSLEEVPPRAVHRSCHRCQVLS